MKSIQSNRRTIGRRRKQLFVATLFLVVVLVGSRLFAPNASTSFVRTIYAPLFGTANALGINFETLGAYFKSKDGLQKENNELRNQLDEYYAETLVFDALKIENAELARALGRRENGSTVLPAVILSKPPQSTYDTIIIDTGRNDGVIEGDYLYTSEHIYMGRITTVGASISSARLASSPGVETQAVVMPADIQLTISGLGGGAFEAELPIDIEINKGDKILTRGSSPQVIAIVQEVYSRPSDSFQTMRALSPVNISALSWVSVYHSFELTESIKSEEL